MSPSMIFFDVLGTVVEWRRCIANELSATARRALQNRIRDLSADMRARISGMSTSSWQEIAEEWHRSYMNFGHTYDPSKPFVSVDEHNRLSLEDILTKWLLRDLFNEDDLKDLTLAWHRLDSYPDSVPGLSLLGTKFLTSTLSNGNVKLLEDLQEHSSLPFKYITSAEHLGAYKPSPEAYYGAARRFGLRNSECCLVAAHLEDLQAAKNCGFQTIYVERDSEEAWDSSGVARAREEGQLPAVIDLARKDIGQRIAGEFPTKEETGDCIAAESRVIEHKWLPTGEDQNCQDGSIEDGVKMLLLSPREAKVCMGKRLPVGAFSGSLDAFSNWFVSLNDVIYHVKSYASQLATVYDKSIGFDNLQSFIFPGSKVFTYKSPQLSGHQDLVCPITYVDTDKPLGTGRGRTRPRYWLQSLEGTASSERFTLTASTDRIENYLQARLVSPTAKFEALQTADGHGLIFSTDSRGAFHVIEEQLGSEAGWAVTDLSTPILGKQFPGKTDARVSAFDVGQCVVNGGISLAMTIRSDNTDPLFVSLENLNSNTAWKQNPSWMQVPFDAKGSSSPQGEPENRSGVSIIQPCYTFLSINLNPYGFPHGKPDPVNNSSKVRPCG
ncbi:hypothetical protein APSETT444_001827 [Aspergillus pseudonomiae]